MNWFGGQNRPSSSLGQADPRQRRPVPLDLVIAEPLKVDKNGRLTVNVDWSGWKQTSGQSNEYWRMFLTMGA